MINIRTDLLGLAVTLCGFMVFASSAAVAQDAAAAEKQAMIAKGLDHETAWDLYLALQAEADGG